MFCDGDKLRPGGAEFNDDITVGIFAIVALATIILKFRNVETKPHDPHTGKVVAADSPMLLRYRYGVWEWMFASGPSSGGRLLNLHRRTCICGSPNRLARAAVIPLYLKRPSTPPNPPVRRATSTRHALRHSRPTHRGGGRDRRQRMLRTRATLRPDRHRAGRLETIFPVRPKISSHQKR